jgi:hypothetical protein
MRIKLTYTPIKLDFNDLFLKKIINIFKISIYVKFIY